MPKLSLAKLERHLYSAADILRREGMDAATYKDFIFGMLFLKRSSDVFEESRKKINPKHAENPDYYDDFFLPEKARWAYLQEHLNDAKEPFGGRLDKALSALSEANESLEHVLDHIQFMKVQGNKRIVSDEACKELVRHFSRYRLLNEDFQFSDLLSSADELLINWFAESAGKKGADFYTPRDVIRLMVRMLAPTQGMSICDPTCGSGGMLIITREHIEHSGGDPTNLRLCGQVNDASAWSICKLNMLLHGIRGADIQLQDTLLHPQHREGGELERFDRVIANPPFSQNYTKSNMEYPERFRWGWCPTTGKKGDLMFAQHMLAVCKDRGMVCTVMPHGVLFRGGAEKEIRTKLLKQDLIEAIISLPPNLFYGAGIPACLLVMRPNLATNFPNPNKTKERRGKVLFINADAEFYAGRAQNYQPRCESPLEQSECAGKCRGRGAETPSRSTGFGTGRVLSGAASRAPPDRYRRPARARSRRSSGSGIPAGAAWRSLPARDSSPLAGWGGPAASPRRLALRPCLPLPRIVQAC